MSRLLALDALAVLHITGGHQALSTIPGAAAEPRDCAWRIEHQNTERENPVARRATKRNDTEEGSHGQEQAPSRTRSSAQERTQGTGRRRERITAIPPRQRREGGRTRATARHLSESSSSLASQAGRTSHMRDTNQRDHTRAQRVQRANTAGPEPRGDEVSQEPPEAPRDGVENGFCDRAIHEPPAKDGGIFHSYMPRKYSGCVLKGQLGSLQSPGLRNQAGS